MRVGMVLGDDGWEGQVDGSWGGIWRGRAGG